MTHKLIELENCSWHNNICIDGIEEEQYETWDRCEEKVQKFIKEKLDIQGEVEIDCCQEMKKAKKIGQMMKEICVHRQLFVDCLDLKVSKELCEVSKS